MSTATTELRKTHHLFVSPDRTQVAEVEVIDLDERDWQALPESRDPAWRPHRVGGRVRAVRLTI